MLRNQQKELKNEVAFFLKVMSLCKMNLTQAPASYKIVTNFFTLKLPEYHEVDIEN